MFRYKSQTSCHLKPWEQINWHFPKQSPANGELVVWDLLVLTIPLGNNPMKIFVDLRVSKPPGPKPFNLPFCDSK